MARALLVLLFIFVGLIALFNSEVVSSVRRGGDRDEEHGDISTEGQYEDAYEDMYTDADEYYNEQLLREIQNELMQEEGEEEAVKDEEMTSNHAEGDNVHSHHTQQDNAEKKETRYKSSQGGYMNRGKSKLRGASSSPKDRGKGAGSRERKRAQKGSGGSYYGGGASFMKTDKHSQNIQAKHKMASGADKHKINLDSIFNDDLKANIAESQHKKQEVSQHQRYLFACYTTPRRFARPVELILHAYNPPDGYVDFYSVLNVPNHIEPLELKKKYRALALVVHPDKNPHPSAKEAFDAIQDAYEVLSSPTRRKEYDQMLGKRRLQRRWSVKKAVKGVKNSVYNMKSRALVTLYRLRHGKLHEEWSEGYALIKERLDSLDEGIKHFILLPSMLDRISRVNELWMDYKLYLIIPLLSLILSPI